MEFTFISRSSKLISWKEQTSCVSSAMLFFHVKLRAWTNLFTGCTAIFYPRGLMLPRTCRSQPRPQGFSLKKWVGREKALASAGHVHSLNIPEKLIYMQPAGFALTEVERSNNGK